MRWLENRLPPPLVLLLFGAAMWGATRAWPQLSSDYPARMSAATMLAATGLAIGVAGIVAFHRHKTTVDPLHPDRASALVQSGVYQLTRNPMYLGMAFILVGWAAYLSHPATLPIVAAFVLFIDRFQIAPEERALAAKFGDAFMAYRRKVRRWL